SVAGFLWMARSRASTRSRGAASSARPGRWSLARWMATGWIAMAKFCGRGFPRERATSSY
ncbi:MAG: hypothetical protein NTY53_17590, partial [Kiritimatiellaeota bacterium]|nr:hypothetical protein [Kiritimatiellota bacterium]